MTAASGVPPWARPVLEALENLACGYIGPDWRAVKDAITAALASDAGAPSPERIVRHPNGHLMVESARPYMPTEAEEAAALTSLAKASPVLAQHATHIDGEFDLALTAVRRMFATWRDRAKAGAAPDAELDRLLEDYGEEWGERARMQVGWTEGDLARSVAIIAEYRAAVHAHVERRVREAAPDWSAVRRAALIFAQDGDCHALDLRLAEAGAPAGPMPHEQQVAPALRREKEDV